MVHLHVDRQQAVLPGTHKLVSLRITNDAARHLDVRSQACSGGAPTC